jgi:hypothetical protein
MIQITKHSYQFTNRNCVLQVYTQHTKAFGKIIQLKNITGVPELFFKSLASKINNQVFDGGEYFQLLLLDYEDAGRDEKDPAFTVIAMQNVSVDDPNAIFLIDHALTFNSDVR